MPSCNTYHLTWVSLTLGVGYLFTMLQQSTATTPHLGEGYLLTSSVPDLQRGLASLGPPAPAQALLLGMLLLAAGPGLGRGWLLPAAAPGLGLGVAPQGHHPWPRV